MTDAPRLPGKSPRSVTRFGLAAFAVAALVATAFTWWIVAHTESNSLDPNLLTIVAAANLLLILGVAMVVMRRAIGLWAALQRGRVSRLQRRLILLFSTVTVIPALLVAVFSTLLFHFGVQAWFDERIDEALTDSVAVAQSYLREHAEIIRADAVAMAHDLDLQMRELVQNQELLESTINGQAALRSLTEAMLVHRGRVVAQTRLSFALAFERLEADKLERMNQGEVVVWVENDEKIRALIKLSSLSETHLLIGRLVDDRVLRYMDEARGGYAEYKRLKASTDELQAQFVLVYFLLTVLLLLIAAWYGTVFADRLLGPIGGLIRAAERVGSGDFTVRVPTGNQSDEIATLGVAFNRMTAELERQRGELIEVNRQLDARRRFIEAVIGGVSAGIIALSRPQRVSLHNRTASQLLFPGEEVRLRGQPLASLLPEIQPLLDAAAEAPDQVVQQELTYRRGPTERTLLLRVGAETYRDQIEGYIVTIDDITELAAAQRSAAWSDVARRVAHEIKNPLTPIQLAAERLRRKYTKYITEDRENYERYIDTITRHVSEIRRMVEEFVSFARMPTPQFALEDMEALLKKVIFSEQVAHSSIRYDLNIGQGPHGVLCDERQITRLFTNLLKNAAEAIEAKLAHQPQGSMTGRIAVTAGRADGSYVIEVQDNGPGFPPQQIHRLTEPYVTTREKGTGLGLAIVKRIMEEHGGEVVLQNSDEGALVRLIFSVDSGNNVA